MKYKVLLLLTCTSLIAEDTKQNENNQALTDAEIWEIYGYFPRDSKVRSFCEANHSADCTTIAEYYNSVKRYVDAEKKLEKLEDDYEKTTEIIKDRRATPELIEHLAKKSVLLAEKLNKQQSVIKKHVYDRNNLINSAFTAFLAIMNTDKGVHDLHNKVAKNIIFNNYQRYFFEDWYWKLFKKQ